MADSSSTLSTRALAAWSAMLSEALASISDAETPQRLGLALRELVPFDASSSFALRRHSAPLKFFDDLPSGAEPVSYADSPYLLDPVYVSFLKGELPVCCCTLDEICPDGFRESDYFHQYWHYVDIVSEFSFNIPCESDSVLHLSMLRRGASKPFTEDELDRFRAVAPVVATTLLAFWDARKDDFSANYQDADAFHAHLSYVLENFGSSVLTGREREVVHLTMRGYSDKLTARELKITPGTVRNHKKSIFSKLNVSSQGQVFGLLLQVLHLPTPGDDGGDPLSALLSQQI
ncbi:MAG: helix-turn-helix transcriptional regulator [Woeseiaceae bacterium]